MHWASTKADLGTTLAALPHWHVLMIRLESSKFASLHDPNVGHMASIPWMPQGVSGVGESGLA